MATESRAERPAARVLARCLFAALTLFALGGTAQAADEVKQLVPMGDAVGIYVQMQGVMVVDAVKFDSGEGQSSPAREAGILPGDVIINIAGRAVESAEDVYEAAEALDGSPVELTLRRCGQEKRVSLTPHYNGEKYELGLWLRDSMAGLGTLTYYDPDSGGFGALGHCISDIDTGVTMPIRSGKVLSAAINGVMKGGDGEPGQLQGGIDADNSIGWVEENTESGIFGGLSDPSAAEGRQAMPIARDSEIKTGPATILSTVSGRKPESFDIEICRLHSGGRGMTVKVTDERLLEMTGGIVQGMSGSPIIQGGKLVGAVTHVLINDSAKGYGLSIEGMLGAADSDPAFLPAA